MMNNEQVAVRGWMRDRVGLPQYTDMLINNGFDRFDIIRGLSANDLAQIGISMVGHQRQIMAAISALGTPVGVVVAAPAQEGLLMPPSQVADVPADDVRPTRIAYGYFAAAVTLYHFAGIIFWMWSMTIVSITGFESYWTALFLFCGFVPAAVNFIWLVADATVACCNPSGQMPDKICCCGCFASAKMIMFVPIAVAAVLRSILFVALFGILADWLNEEESEQHIDNVFWIIVCWASFDVGPMILVAIDWWYYYGKKDMNGLFGTHKQPMRVIVGQSCMVMIMSWSFMAMLGQYGAGFDVVWPWLFHGIVSTAALVFCAVIQFSGAVKGNTLNNTLLWTASKVLAVLMGAVICAVLYEVFVFMVHWTIWIAFFFYTALTVPSIVGMASFKDVTAMQKVTEVEMQQSGTQHVAPAANQMAFSQYADVPPASPGLGL
jgi:hypothetical protein